ncbi:expressed protein [Arabidopsis lyrata subsp. lyrata]|uniref:Expressed protein n=1 Tax=Arabidopsis lyrata subsp. lyrata TaxID=81972 RepID=D7LBS3_ARALL|nr:expressed protein [Arabidopsis lyrata subsp. lyrata]
MGSILTKDPPETNQRRASFSVKLSNYGRLGLSIPAATSRRQGALLFFFPPRYYRVISF